MNMLCRFVLAALLLGTTACDIPFGPQDTPRNLQEARARWEAQGLEDYYFDFERACFCAPEEVEPARIEVREGAIVAVRSRTTGEPLPQSNVVRWYSIEDLFRLIANAEEVGNLTEVEYHGTGYPTLIDTGTRAVDSGVLYLLANVTPVR